jgi:GT2 family glycosyltransferase
MASKPLASVIVLNWNGMTFLRTSLSSLTSQTYPDYEIVFVDNGSTDNSIEYVRQNFPAVNIIKNAGNLGFSTGNNIGFKNTKGKYVITLNNDTKVQSNFIEELVRIAESDRKIGSVGCKILQFDGTIQYGPKFTNRFGLIISAHKPESYDNFSFTLANCACACLYRRSVIEKIGGFDEYFWTDWEDHDLGLRINLCGSKNAYTPKTTVLHVGGGTVKLSKTDKERYLRIIRNTIFTYVKNYEAENLILPLIFFVSYSIANHFLFIVHNELRILRNCSQNNTDTYNVLINNRKKYPAIFGAFFQFLKDKLIWAKRREIQAMRTVPDKHVFSITRERVAKMV